MSSGSASPAVADRTANRSADTLTSRRAAHPSQLRKYVDTPSLPIVVTGGVSSGTYALRRRPSSAAQSSGRNRRQAATGGLVAGGRDRHARPGSWRPCGARGSTDSPRPPSGGRRWESRCRRRSTPRGRARGHPTRQARPHCDELLQALLVAVQQPGGPRLIDLCSRRASAPRR